MDYENLKLIHLHGDERVPMHEAHHDPAAHDAERGWLSGARIFRCSRCDEQVVVMPEDEQGVRKEPA
jgi:hypothetical protein